MAQATYVKEVATAGGKKKYRAEIWHKGVFYTSKTFDVRSLAVRFKEVELVKAIKGTLQSAAVRKQQRTADADLNQSIAYWAQRYVVENPGAHGKTRLNDYLLVGRLLADKTLRHFDGKTGAQLIKQLSKDWELDRLPRSLSPVTPAKPIEPLKENTIRLRLSALMRLLHFAKTELPPGAKYQSPAMDELFEFTMPPAHAIPRTREPSDSEYGRLLAQLDGEGDFADFLKIIDETGCRLGEVLSAKEGNVDLFLFGGTIIGGCLRLENHKTIKKTKEKRHVPLSLWAAQVFANRIVDTVGDAALFKSLGNADAVCKTFDETCRAVEIENLVIKDFRRAFINRNKYCLSSMDLFQVVGKSSLLTSKEATDSEKAVLAAVGHTSLKTTAGYSVVDVQGLAQVFTRTSRMSRVALGADTSATVDAKDVEEMASLQAELAKTLQKMCSLGITSGTRVNSAGYTNQRHRAIDNRLPALTPQKLTFEALPA
jgi:integrase